MIVAIHRGEGMLSNFGFHRVSVRMRGWWIQHESSRRRAGRLLYADAAGLSRGRAVPLRDLEQRLGTGVGWVPADQAIAPLDRSASRTRGAPSATFVFVPDVATATRVDLWHRRARAPLLSLRRGHAWRRAVGSVSTCPAQARTRPPGLSETGLTLVAAFEHEFMLRPRRPRPAPPFSIEEALRIAAHVRRAPRRGSPAFRTQPRDFPSRVWSEPVRGDVHPP